MRVPPHHLVRGPATELLEHRRGRTGLDMPARPGVSQVMPAKVLDAGTLKSSSPRLRVRLPHWVPPDRGHVRQVLAEPTADDLHGSLRQWHSDRLTCFRLIRVNPRYTPHSIDLGPLESGDIRAAKPSLEAELRHHPQVSG